MSEFKGSFDIDVTEPVGIKDDSGKPNYALIPVKAERKVVEVITFGAAKYKPWNWRHVETERLLAAAMRHIAEYRSGVILDNETEKHPLAHAAANLLFIIDKES